MAPCAEHCAFSYGTDEMLLGVLTVCHGIGKPCSALMQLYARYTVDEVLGVDEPLHAQRTN